MNEMIVKIYMVIQSMIIDFKMEFDNKDRIGVVIEHIEDITMDARGFERRAQGLCIRDSKQIILDREFVLTHGYYEIKKVLYHEIGHCFYDLDDDNSTRSIMDKRVDSVNKDGSNWKELVENLKERIRKNAQ
jgi:hypothetical protein